MLASSTSRIWEWFRPLIADNSQLPIVIQREIVRNLYSKTGSVTAANVSATAAAVVCAFETRWSGFLVWAAIMVAIAPIRLSIIRRFAAVSDGDFPPGLWLDRMSYCSLATTGMVGLLAFSLPVFDQPMVQIFVITIALAIVWGAVARNSLVPRLAFIQCMQISLPLIAAALIRGGWEYYLLAILMTGALAAKLQIVHRNFAQARDALVGRFQREALVVELERQSRAAAAASSATSAQLIEMSHELRTPLNAIIGFAEIIATQAIGPIESPAARDKYHEYANDIQYSGKHLLTLINRVLDTARSEYREAAVKLSEVDIQDSIVGAAVMLRPQAIKAGVELMLPRADEALRCVTDPTRLHQVILNLGSNAIKFTPPSGSVTIAARPLGDGGHILISVVDTGIGIHPDDLERILEPFERVDAVLPKQVESTGLGLPLTKHIVESLGGAFSLESEAGRGTRVEVRLPVTPPAALTA